MKYSKLFLLAGLILSKTSYCALATSPTDSLPGTSRHTISPANIDISQSDGLDFKTTPARPTILEQALINLGCIQWEEIRNLTPRIIEIVRVMRKPNKGPFILKPGIQILYLEDIK